MTGVKRRRIAHIEIAQRVERRQVADIDKGIAFGMAALSPRRLASTRIGGERRSAF
jgi:hypothetical protein